MYKIVYKIDYSNNAYPSSDSTVLTTRVDSSDRLLEHIDLYMPDAVSRASVRDFLIRDATQLKITVFQNGELMRDGFLYEQIRRKQEVWAEASRAVRRANGEMY